MESSGNAALAGRELPESEVIAIDRRLTALAKWLAGHGVPGGLGQLRAVAFTAQLLGRPLTSLLPPDSPFATGSDPAVTGTIHLTMPLATWAGLAKTAGEVSGYGPVDAATSRELAQVLDHQHFVRPGDRMRAKSDLAV